MIPKYNPNKKATPHTWYWEEVESKCFVSEAGAFLCHYETSVCMVVMAKQRLEEKGYRTDFAEWDESGRLIKWLEDVEK